ncbi:hypothetical protein BJY52DRAFT_320842 [Lactarius psammicola]|nr:hypothetical protein BJY52DRAFT_320842 [Lactarius psammicola]
MSPLLPAARAHQAERHPALDAGIRRDPPYIDPSPGAGTTLLSSDPHWDEYYEYEEPEDDPDTLLPPAVPVHTTDVLSSSTQGSPTIPTIGQVPSVVGNPTLHLSSSSLVSTSILPSVINPSDTTLSPLPPVTTTSIFTPTTTTPQNTGLGFQGPRFGSTTLPAKVALTPSTDSNPVLSGSAGGAKKRTGFPGGAVAAIVIILLLVMGALAFFLLRRRRIQRRTARRVTWTANAWQQPTAEASLEKGAAETDPISLSDIGAPAGVPSTRGNEGVGGAAQPRVPIIPRKSPPPYLNIPQADEASATQPRSNDNPVYSSAPSPQPSVVRTVATESTQDVTALVRVTFVPQLPDELAIAPGETLYIRTEFDDGWALCANARGEQGMVPLECLEGGGGQFAEFQPPPVDWHNRDSRRVSSLRSLVV